MDEKHEERKKLINEYYQSKNYLKPPNPQLIFDELPNVWNLMEEKGLKPEGMDYNQFVSIVINSFSQARMGIF